MASNVCQSCGKFFPRVGRGRPRKRCDACEEKKKAAGTASVADGKRQQKRDQWVCRETAELHRQTGGLHYDVRTGASDDDPMAALRQAVMIRRQVDEVIAAVVHQARGRDVPWKEICASLGQDPKTVGKKYDAEKMAKKCAERTDGQVDRSAPPRPAASPPIPPPRRPPTGEAAPPDPAGPSGPPGTGSRRPRPDRFSWTISLPLWPRRGADQFPGPHPLLDQPLPPAKNNLIPDSWPTAYGTSSSSRPDDNPHEPASP